MNALEKLVPLFRRRIWAMSLALVLSLITLISGVALLGTSGWFITATALTTTPYVSLHVPAEERAAGVDTMLTELAGPLKATLEAGEPCH